MLKDAKLVKQYFGLRFGIGERCSDGVYAVPCETSKGNAFMKMTIKNNEFSGKDNFSLFWDEKLTLSFYDTPKPNVFRESLFSDLFRRIIKANETI